MSGTNDEPSTQFLIFKDCLARRLLSYPAFASQTDPVDSDELDDFTSFLATEAWDALPEALQQLSPGLPAAGDTRTGDIDVDELISGALDLIPPTVLDSLTTYVAPSPSPSSMPVSLIQPSASKSKKLSKKPTKPKAPPSALFSAHNLLEDVLNEYSTEARTTDPDMPLILKGAPPKGGWKSTRTDECEICEREISLTYHHLIPRAVHDKVLKRGWHPVERLNSVAWLCRHCHSFVHRVATHEELAREFYTVEMLLEREDIQKWRAYASRQRWGVRPKRKPASHLAGEVLRQGG